MHQFTRTLRHCRRFNIVGTSGSGKSTFGRKLADALSIPYFSMDQLYWKPNWEESTVDEFAEVVQEVTRGDEWVLDGNYHSKTQQIKWSRAEAVIWLDMPRWRTFQQITQRSIARILSRKEVWPNTGNVETFRRTFLSHESVLLWSLTSYSRLRRRYESCMRDPQWQTVQFVRLSSRTAVANFLRDVAVENRPAECQKS